ncbi:MAG: phosphatase PAP2 family protein [Desulfobacterales bacterium]|jgi:membrane-associated phospholipid phosphatase
MESILGSGVNTILWFQKFSPSLDVPFRILTFMGEEGFFLIFFPLIYWCLDRRFGIKLMILFFLSTYLNAIAKIIAGQPRPFEYDPRIKQLIEAEGGGLPSNHTQSAVIIWGCLASEFRKKWLWGFAILLMILIPLSRVYLGVHFPSDILGGYILGGLLLILYFWLAPRIEQTIVKMHIVWQLIVIILLSIILMLIYPGCDKVCNTLVGTLTGLCFGSVLERHYLGFKVNGIWWKRVLRYLSGMLVLLGLWIGLKKLLAGFDPQGVFRFMRYGFMGLWVGFGAPWMFTKVKLSEI